jgi:hypothetical protein
LPEARSASMICLMKFEVEGACGLFTAGF